VLRALIREARFAEALADVAMANLRSLLLVGGLLPLVVSVGGWLLGLALSLGFHVAGMEQASRTAGTWILVLSGWVFDSEWVRKMFPYQFLAWFTVSYVLSVFVEGGVLRRRWQARQVAADGAMRVSWLMNAASYAGLAVALVYMARTYGHW
jgi:hypothetical protein